MNVRWFTMPGVGSKNHRALTDDKQLIMAGGVQLACGRTSPLDGSVHYMTWNNSPITCSGCLRRPNGPPEPHVPNDLTEVCWARFSEYNGDVLGFPRTHLTEGDGRTCCGVPIPRELPYERPGYRVDWHETHRECERCFTDARKALIRDLDAAYFARMHEQKLRNW